MPLVAACVVSDLVCLSVSKQTTHVVRKLLVEETKEQSLPLKTPATWYQLAKENTGHQEIISTTACNITH